MRDKRFLLALITPPALEARVTFRTERSLILQMHLRKHKILVQKAKRQWGWLKKMKELLSLD